MSKYTTEVRFICEMLAGFTKSQNETKIEEVIAKARPKIFDFDFPIFDENYRSLLEIKILRHYYFYEIGFETVGLWKAYLNRSLNEIMPYYNQLYKSQLLEFNPLYDVDYKKNTGRNVEHKSDSLRNDSGSDAYSDTPQGSLQNVQDMSYLTNATITKGDSKYNATDKESDKYFEHTIGKTPGKSFSEMLTDYRKTFLNIDMMVIDDLADLFMLIW